MQQEGWYQFLELCVSSNDKKLLDMLFDLFLTPEEKASIALRCLIVRDLLKQKKTQRQIAEDLQVSIAKITRGSNELKRISTQLTKYLNKKFS